MNKFKSAVLVVFTFVIILFPIIPLLHSGLPNTHDGQDHVARIMAFYQNLEEGVLIPRWGAFLNWGYGHPILEFLYPLPSYIASIFHLLSFSFFDSVKFVFILGSVLSFIFMYVWLKEFMGKEASIFGAVLFTYAPYRFIDLYVRGDIGENLAFVFVPLTFLFIYKFFKTQNNLYGIYSSFSIAFLILSHNAIALFTTPIIFLYGVYLWWNYKFNNRLLFGFLISFAFGFLLSLFFWLPALLEGKYTLRNIVTAGGYVSHFASLEKLIYGPWNFGGSGQFSVQLGIFQWLFLIVSPFLIYKYFVKKNKNYVLLASCLIISIFAIFLMLSMSSFVWSKLIILQNLQFPWRFLSVLVLTTSVMGAFLVENLFKKYKAILTFVLIIFVLIFSKDYIKANGYFYNLKHLEENVYKSTTDTGESAPIWSVRFMEKTPKAPIEIIEGKGEVKEVVHRGTYRQYEFEGEGSARVLINILYFPNWTIYVDGKKRVTEFQDSDYRGLMTFIVNGGKHKIEAKYEDTRLRRHSNYVSFLALLTAVSFAIYRLTKKVKT